jgi:hypothetical protein
LFALIDGSRHGCEVGAKARIVWVAYISYPVVVKSAKPVAIRFKKKQRDSGSLTVLVEGCKAPEISLKYDQPDARIASPAWRRR